MGPRQKFVLSLEKSKIILFILHIMHIAYVLHNAYLVHIAYSFYIICIFLAYFVHISHMFYEYTADFALRAEYRHKKIDKR